MNNVLKIGKDNYFLLLPKILSFKAELKKNKTN